MKVLIIRFSSIGDIILTTPIARAINEQIPNSEVHFLTKKHFTGLLQNNPNISKIWGFDKNAKGLLKSLKAEKYDHIVDLHNNLRTKRFSLLLRVPTKRLNKLNWQKWVMVRLKKNLLPDKHIVDRNFDVVAGLNVTNDNKGLNYFIDETCQIPDSIRVPNRYVCYAIGGQHATKKMPHSKMIEFCDKSEITVVLIGGKEDEEMGRKLESSCRNVISLCGKLSIDQSALIMKNALWVVTHDTGMMHIAAALKKKIISIWGNTIPEFGMYPYLPDDESKSFEVSDLHCRPCSKIGYEKCPVDNFNCMNQQDIDGMLRVIAESASISD